MSSLTRLAIGFVFGALSILLFEQTTIFALNQLGLTQIPVYSLRPVAPLALPQIANQCFIGGLWGILFVFLWDRSSFQARGNAVAIVFGLFAAILMWGAAQLVFSDMKAIACGVVFGLVFGGLIALFGPAVLFGALFGVFGPAVVNWVVLPAIRGQTMFGGRIGTAVLINGMFGLGLAVLLSLMARIGGRG
jgi:hypothetical protein